MSTNDLQYELMKMVVGDRIAQDNIEWMRVPGGWVIAYWGDVHTDLEPVVTATTFVQEPVMIHQPKKKRGAGLVLPT